MTDDLTRLTDEEREQLWQSGEVSIINCDPDSNLVRAVESLLAARLAGAGAQVTETAVEAARKVLFESDDDRNDGSRFYYEQTARAALSAALPHMGTGQSEADLRDELERAERERDEFDRQAVAEHRRAEEWRGEAQRNLRLSLDYMAERDDLRARISALADDKDRQGQEALFRDANGNWWPAPILPDELRALLDRPAAAEGNETDG